MGTYPLRTATNAFPETIATILSGVLQVGVFESNQRSVERFDRRYNCVVNNRALVQAWKAWKLRVGGSKASGQSRDESERDLHIDVFGGGKLKDASKRSVWGWNSNLNGVGEVGVEDADDLDEQVSISAAVVAL